MERAKHPHVETEVLVVGAGPVGLTLAYALGKSGIRCHLIECSEQPGILPKMDLTNPRSMEIFGRLGLAEKIRGAGWPLDAQFNVYVGASLVEAPYAVIEYPSILEMQQEIACCTDGSLPREPYERISQYHLEELLCREARAMPNVTVEFGCALVSLEDKGDGVTAIVRDATGERRITAAYVVGCDGGNSTVRRSLDIDYSGQFAVNRMFMIFFRSPELLQRAGLEAFRHYMLAGDRQAVLVAQDDLERWSLHVMIADDVDATELDPMIEIRAALGLDLDVEILYSGAWTPHLVVADSYGSRRIFLAGDSAHQYIPTGGFGMNTGVAEADNLAWKLAAVLRGWGGQGLLDSYEDERRPIALRNCRAAEYAATGVVLWRKRYRPDLRYTDAQNQAARRQFLAAVNTYQRRSHEQRGVEMGYRYTESQVCWHEPVGTPDPDSPIFVTSAAPGARLPHAWIEAGLSVHDRIGSGMTLMVLASGLADVDALCAAAEGLGIPLDTLDLVGRSDLRALYGADLLLIRPDLHVAWRSGGNTRSAEEILRVCTGRELPENRRRATQTATMRKEIA